MKRIQIFGIGLIALAMTVAQAIPGGGGAQAQTPLPVVATFSIVADLVENVGGELVQVETLVGRNMDAHNFDPSPAEVVNLAEAELIFEIGIEFEPWLEGMVDAAGTGAERVVVSEGVALRTGEDDDHHHDEDEAHDADHDDEYSGDKDHAGEHSDDEHSDDDDHADDHQDEHDHGEFDPHVWQDVANAIVMVENIETALVAADPANAAVYESNAAAYTAELEALDAWIFEQAETLDDDLRKLVTSHDTFGYYADRYGFEVIGTPLGFTTEGADPAAGDIAALIETIQDAGVPAIFTENVQGSDVMTQIASDAGVTLAPPLYTDALGDEGSDGATYLSMMRFNTETIVTALAT